MQKPQNKLITTTSYFISIKIINTGKQKKSTPIPIAIKHHYLKGTLEEKKMNHGGGVFASNNKEKKTMAMALDSSKALSSFSHSCIASKQQTMTTRLSMSLSSSSFSHSTLSYIKNKMTMHKCSYVIVLFMHLHYNKTINDDDMPPPLHVLCKIVAKKKRRRCGNALALLSYLCYKKIIDDNDAFKCVIVIVFLFVLCIKL